MVKYLWTILALLLSYNGSAQDMTNAEYKKAIFAGGCFWCLEAPFDKVDGVVKTISGYSGGQTQNPTYAEVSSGKSGHVEVLYVEYDPKKVSYEELLKIFWRNIDPVDDGGQFCDRGRQYRSGVFAFGDEQMQLATQSRNVIDESGVLDKKIVTQIVNASPFYPAEDFHQNYYNKNPIRYNFYRYRCGRDKRLKELWGNW